MYPFLLSEKRRKKKKKEKTFIGQNLRASSPDLYFSFLLVHATSLSHHPSHSSISSPHHASYSPPNGHHGVTLLFSSSWDLNMHAAMSTPFDFHLKINRSLPQVASMCTQQWWTNLDRPHHPSTLDDRTPEMGHTGLVLGLVYSWQSLKQEEKYIAPNHRRITQMC